MNRILYTILISFLLFSCANSKTSSLPPEIIDSIKYNLEKYGEPLYVTRELIDGNRVIKVAWIDKAKDKELIRMIFTKSDQDQFFYLMTP